MESLKNILSAILLLLILYSCDSKNYLFEETKPIEKGAWTYNNTLDFTFDIQDTTTIYNIYLALDHTNDYPYQNLYLKVHTLFPSGKKMERPVSFELADKYGQWYGECGSETCRLLVPFQSKTYFNAIGKHTITLEQYMRKDPIEGIEGLSLMVENTGVGR